MSETTLVSSRENLLKQNLPGDNDPLKTIPLGIVG